MENNEEFRLDFLVPGTELREGLEIIAERKRGALIVVGNATKLEKISTGGFSLNTSEFSSNKLAELAKMDGAIVLNDNVTRILKANVHLNPSSAISTSQTGTRHRTAERVTKETGLMTITISEESSIIKVFVGSNIFELEDQTTLLGKVNESLQSVDRTRRRFEESLLELSELEVQGSLTNQNVLDVLQKGELLVRLASTVKNEASKLGEASGIITIQIDSLESGIDQTLSLIIKDHILGKKYRNVEKVKDVIAKISYEELNSLSVLGSLLGKEALDEVSISKGYRVLARLPGIPDNIQDLLVVKFKVLTKILVASADDLNSVEGIGRQRAQQLRLYFDGLLQVSGLSYSNGQ